MSTSGCPQMGEKLRYLIVIGVCLIGFVACGEGDKKESTLPFDRTTFELGQQVFEKNCRSCHSVDSGQNGTGPHLADLDGRKAGSIRGFKKYSAALKSSNIVWTADSIDKFIANPRGYIPGSVMAVGKTTDRGARDAVIYFLLTKEEK